MVVVCEDNLRERSDELTIWNVVLFISIYDLKKSFKKSVLFCKQLCHKQPQNRSGTSPFPAARAQPSRYCSHPSHNSSLPWGLICNGSARENHRWATVPVQCGAFPAFKLSLHCFHESRLCSVTRKHLAFAEMHLFTHFLPSILMIHFACGQTEPR